MKDARKEIDHNTGRNYKADSGAVVVMEAKTGRVVSMASNPDVRPQRLGRRHLRQGLRQAHRQEVQLPAAQPGHPGPGRARLDLQGRLLDRRGQRRLRLRRQLRLLGSRTPSAARPSRTSSPRATARSASAARWRSPATPSSTASRTRSGRRTAATSRRRTPTTGSTRPPTTSASATRPASTSPTRSPAASRTASGSRTTGRRTRTPGASRARRTATYVEQDRLRRTASRA